MMNDNDVLRGIHGSGILLVKVARMANCLSPKGACRGHCPEDVNHVLSRKEEFRFQCNVCKKKKKSVWMFK